MIHPAHDPLANPQPLIERVYAYVAYRIGDGAAAEDITSEVFERALRYRRSYNARRGTPISWLIGIARRAIADHAATPRAASYEPPDSAAPGTLEDDTLDRLEVRAAVATLSERDRELVALRYGADLTAAQIGRVVGMGTNTVEVALHRALGQLRHVLVEATEDPAAASLLRRVHL